MNDLLIQDTFEPYYAGRHGYAAPESPRRRKPAEKKEAVAAEGKVEAPENRPAAAGDH